MIASVPGWIQDAGVIAASVTAVIGLLTIFVRSRPGRWAIRLIREDHAEQRRQQITEVLDETLPKYLAPILHEVSPNGGKSMKDSLDRVDRDLQAFIAYQHDVNHRAANEMTAAVGLARTNMHRIEALERWIPHPPPTDER